MPEWLSKFFLDIIKLSPRFLVMIALASAFLIFGEESWVQGIWLSEIRQNYRTWIGGAFLLSCVGLFSHALFSLWAWIVDRWKGRQALRKLRERLHALTAEEENILRHYIAGQTRTQELDCTNGVVAGLLIAGIIQKVSNYGNPVDGWACNIHPWAWKYLNAHPELLRVD